MGENTGQNVFFTEEIAFLFKKIRVFNNILVVTEKILQFPKVSEHLVDSYKLSPQVFHTQFCQKKTGQNLFFTGKVAFFFKNLCLHQALRS